MRGSLNHDQVPIVHLEEEQNVGIPLPKPQVPPEPQEPQLPLEPQDPQVLHMPQSPFIK